MTLARTLTAASATDRHGTDYYPTPADVTEALLNYLALPQGTRIWEPACGEGHMSRVLAERGYAVESSDKYNRGYGEVGIDFLHTSSASDVEWIITNPPFSLASAFIQTALQLKRPFALLLKSQFWHAQSRRKLFESHRPSAVLALTWRPDFHFGAKGGSPTMECIWVVWDAQPAQYTAYHLLQRPTADDLR